MASRVAASASSRRPSALKNAPRFVQRHREIGQEGIGSVGREAAANRDRLARRRKSGLAPAKGAQKRLPRLFNAAA